jgi:hypothetical protein
MFYHIQPATSDDCNASTDPGTSLGITSSNDIARNGKEGSTGSHDFQEKEIEVLEIRE